ncbi:MAG: hypothetical protein ABIQ86_09665 [Steroidobacteraceae bacterium]
MKAIPLHYFRPALVAGLLALLTGIISGAVHAASKPRDPADALIDTIAAGQNQRVTFALARIEGTDRRLLALRSYLRAGPGLADRWSWTAEQIVSFGQSPENRAMQTEIEQVRERFAAANPGYALWVNPEVRSLDTQLANWNSNESVSRAARRLLASFLEWRGSPMVRAMSAADIGTAAGKFLVGYVPTPTPTLAAPGLSPHGQMRAIDFQIQKGGRTVAGPRSATIASDWDAAGWTAKLKSAVRAGSSRFTGPLESPREPWHYTYSPKSLASSR